MNRPALESPSAVPTAAIALPRRHCRSHCHFGTADLTRHILRSYAPVIRNVSLEQASTGGNVTAVLKLYDVVTDMAETDVLSVTGKAQATFRLVNMLTKATDVQVSSAGVEVGAGGGCPRLQNSVVLVCRGTHEAMRQPGSGRRCCLLSCREHSHHKKRMAWIFLWLVVAFTSLLALCTYRRRHRCLPGYKTGRRYQICPALVCGRRHGQRRQIASV